MDEAKAPPVSSRQAKVSGNSAYFKDEYSSILHLTIAVAMLSVFIADLCTPLGYAVWVFYLVPVTMSLWLWRPQLPVVVAMVATALMAVGFVTSTPGLDARIVQTNRIFGVFTIWIMGIVGYFFIQNRVAVRRQQWLQAGRTSLNMMMAGDLKPAQLGQKILKFLAEYLDAQSGVMFIKEEAHFRRTSVYGIPQEASVPEAFLPGEGLPGQAAQDRRSFFIADVPEDYVRVGSALGHSRPRTVLIAPMQVDGSVNAVIELSFVHVATDLALELLEIVSEAVAVAVRSGNYRAHLQNLLEETQRQAEELQVQSEELRVSNEELEEQSRALKESQTRLEQQQIELEQTNSQLEEQAQVLEAHRDDLAAAQADLQAKARDLERASRYKSEFLANMSHELRTPLNSSLILARLLADNHEGNLTEDQIKSARTILSSGNDLLLLINDILDLSKIEAGRMEIRPEQIWIQHLARDLAATLEPLAEQKGLQFRLETSQAPESIDTDRQRLEQVLKNLLSNAIKFTDQGHVTLRIRSTPGARVAFEVIDTGIGISEEQRESIFEAFRQVDSAANRKYSGTGLGLSISRELSRLLGGEIGVESVPGQGSTFTVTLPQSYDPESVSASSDLLSDPEGGLLNRPLHSPSSPTREPASVPQKTRPPANFHRRIQDDRERLSQQGRVILVIEDDEAFARILYDLVHELEFQCLVATTAEEGLAVAKQFLPSAIVLDIGLPDHSGLSVLDQLKNDSRSRHIPVHVVSANDYTEAALSLGAVGYMLKPVTREVLWDALKGLESRLAQRMRRVLVVEDDAVQLESLQKLLGSQEVETLGVRSAADCLEQLKNSTFDCMVLDLSLPDASGHSLLETLSREDAYSFPPVIVYTGRDLSADEEHQLRKYSKSIIIKGAKSPERLLDEVTLFLHRVVSDLPAEHQRMIMQARSREAALEGRRILLVEDDVRNIFALSSILEPRGATIQIARNGREALIALDKSLEDPANKIDLVLMDVMMPEMDGLTATREIRKRSQFKRLPIIMLTAKAMKEDQETCLAAGANDYMAKPLDIDQLLSLIRVWMRT